MTVLQELLDKVVVGDSNKLLKQLPDEVVDLVICSPPYFNQRTYTSSPAEIGKEETADDYINVLLDIFEQCVRVTKKTGSIVFNLGDKYVNGSLALVPYRFAAGAAVFGNVKLINNLTWVKSNPTPRQYNRRLVSATEPFFHFVKSNDYYYNLDTMISKKETVSKSDSKVGENYFAKIDASDLTSEEKDNARAELKKVIEEVKSGSLYSFRMKIRGVHSLAFGGEPGGRNTQILTKGFSIIRVPGRTMQRDVLECSVETIRGIKHPAIYPVEIVEFFLRLTTPEAAIVLDPFIGSGTTGVACRKNNRHFIGFELSEEFAHAATARISECDQH